MTPHTQQYLREVDLPFLPGAFPWGPGKPQPRSVVGRLLSSVTLGLAGGTPKTEEVLTKPGDRFQLVVKEHLPASAQAHEHVADPEGTPMARIRLRFKAPGMPQEQDAFPSEDDQWFITEKMFYHVARAPMRGAPALITFSTVDKPELVEDFLKPPAGRQGRRGPVPLRGSNRPRPSLRLGSRRSAGEVDRAAGEWTHASR